MLYITLFWRVGPGKWRTSPLLFKMLSPSDRADPFSKTDLASLVAIFLKLSWSPPERRLMLKLVIAILDHDWLPMPIVWSPSLIPTKAHLRTTRRWAFCKTHVVAATMLHKVDEKWLDIGRGRKETITQWIYIELRLIMHTSLYLCFTLCYSQNRSPSLPQSLSLSRVSPSSFPPSCSDPCGS